MNEIITYQVLQEAIDVGVREFILCPGSRNSSFIEALRREERLTSYYWPEERSAAFFALGRSRATLLPVAIITTSGTAVAEMLSAAMEAYYSGIPLLLITADRPRTFRGSGAPQSAEQIGIFSHYAKFSYDISKDHRNLHLAKWNQRGPAHINVCLEEPRLQPPFTSHYLKIDNSVPVDIPHTNIKHGIESFNRFIGQTASPLVIVSGLKKTSREPVAQLLLSLKVPVILEGTSGLREDPRLQKYRVYRNDRVLITAEQSGYPVDGVLRIGNVPTHSVWRDLEEKRNHIKVCSISEMPFSGLSWSRNVIHGTIERFIEAIAQDFSFQEAASDQWLIEEQRFHDFLQSLFEEEPNAEASLINTLSKQFPENCHIYLGNSLPIREWDLAADASSDKDWLVTANRGLNGIDGQISTFLGLCEEKIPNWALIGDLTALYDMAGFWIRPQISHINFNVVVINNGGGKIFERLYPHNREMLCSHQLNFKPLAEMWGLSYQKWHSISEISETPSQVLIEIVPDPDATLRFWKKLSQYQTSLAENIFKT